MDQSGVIETIKQTPISNIVGRYVSLKRNGANHWGVCPFHRDTKPSMSVNDSKGIFKCFSCGTAGDAITFVQSFNNIDFKEAILEIATSLGLPTEELFQKKNKDPKLAMAHRILSSSSQLYQKVGESNVYPQYKEFVEKRNLNAETVKNFCIGLAPKNNALTNYLNTVPEKERKFALQVAEEIGIIKPNQKENNTNTHYDTFRDRIMFPIWNQFDQIVGFSSRALFDYQHAKYMNSRESLTFNKSAILYGLNFAKAHIRQLDQVILVEGHMDMISMYQYGFKNTSAIMGTALGDSALITLKSMTKNIILALDTDSAGFAAMKRINRDFMNHAILPKYINYAPHKDADEFLQSRSVEELTERIAKAQNFIDTEIDSVIPENIPTDTDKKLEILNQIFEIMSPLKDALIATERLVSAAEKIKMRSTPQQIVDAYKQFLTKQSTQNKHISPIEQKVNPEPRPEPTATARDIAQKRSIPKAEKTILKKLIMHPESFARRELTELIDFATDSRLNIITSLMQDLDSRLEGAEYESAVRNYLTREDLDVEIKEIIADALYCYRPNKLDEKGVDMLLRDLKMALQVANYKTKEDDIRLKISNASNENEKLELMNQIYKLKKERAELKIPKRI